VKAGRFEGVEVRFGHAAGIEFNQVMLGLSVLISPT
jgi:hypothetical protein